MSPADAERPDRVFGPFDASLTKADYAAFARRVGARLTQRHAQRYGAATVFLLLGASAAILVAGWALGFVEDGSGVALFLAAAGALALGKLFTRRQIALAQRAAAAEAAADATLYEGARSVWIDAAGLHLEQEGATRSVPWSSVDSAEEGDGLAIFWTGLAEGVTIPRRAFADAASLAACLAFAEARIAAASRP